MLQLATILAVGEISEEDITEICRTCLSKNATKISILAKNETFKKTYAEILMECVPVHISSSDHFPSNICLNCAASLLKAYGFHQQCFAADTLLQYFSSGYQNNTDNDEENIKDIISLCDNSADPNDGNISSYKYLKKENASITDSYNLNQVHVISHLKSEVLQKNRLELNETNNPDNSAVKNSELPFDTFPDLKADNLSTNEVLSQAADSSVHIERDIAFVEDISVKQELRCNICSKLFTSKSRLERHMIEHTKSLKHSAQAEYPCPNCKLIFKVKSRLAVHMNVHTKNKTFLCDFCGLILSQHNNLKRHRKIHTGQKDFECDICGKAFIQKISMQSHRDTHNDVKNFKCTYCEKLFRTRTGLHRHQISHIEVPEIEVKRKTRGPRLQQKYIRRLHPQLWGCEVCNKEYNSYHGLKQHYVSKHLQVRKYQCSECGKTFRQSGGYLTHMLVHRGLKPYKCRYCGKQFRQKPHVDTHERLHTGSKPFVCQYCHKSFRHQSTLIQHTRIHTGERPYGCHLCNRAFYHSTNLKTHVATHQPKLLKQASPIKTLPEIENKILV